MKRKNTLLTKVELKKELSVCLKEYRTLMAKLFKGGRLKKRHY